MSDTTGAAAATGRELVITRVFDAPRELVWAAWTHPDHARAWGPKGMRWTFAEADVAPGGAWRRCMVADADGTEYWSHGVYREVVEPERLVFTFAWEERDGSPEHETLVTVTLADLGGRTRMTFRQAPFVSAESRDGHEGGWSEAFDDLAAHLARS